jgi:hypothetical protein
MTIQDDVDLLYRALAAPELIKFSYGDDRLANRRGKHLHYIKRKERFRARPDRFSPPVPTPLDRLEIRVRWGNLYIGRAEVLNGALRSSPTEDQPQPLGEPVDSDELASLPPWPPRIARPPSLNRHRNSAV